MLASRQPGGGGGGGGPAPPPRERELTRVGEAASGALAGGFTRLLVAPLDVLKIRFQLQRTPVAALAAQTASAATSAAASAASAASAAAAAAAAATPPRPLYTSMPQAVVALLREEGARTLWRGNASAMALWVAYMAASFPAYRAAHDFAERTLAAPAPKAAVAEATPLAATAAGPAAAPSLRLSSALALGDARVAPPSPPPPPPPPPPAHVAPAILPALFAGAASGFAATLATYPLDWLRTRIAAQGVPRQHATALALVRAVYREEGAVGFFRGLVPTLLQIAPSLAVTFAVYEQAGDAWDAAAEAAARAAAAAERAKLAAARAAAVAAAVAAGATVPPAPPEPPDPSGAAYGAGAGAVSGAGAGAGPSSLRSLASGALAGTVGKLVVFPLDVVKRRMQAQSQQRDARYGAAREPYRGTLDALRSIAREEGPRALLKGLAPSLLKAGAAAALTFWSYETAAARLRQSPLFSEATAAAARPPLKTLI
jgi:solute carrier family 25 thiamine pyrophosphate transporter 19